MSLGRMTPGSLACVSLHILTFAWLPSNIHYRSNVCLFWKEINTKKLKVTVKTFIMLQKISISNKCCSFKLHQRILKKCIKVSTKILSSTTVFNYNNNTCFLRSILEWFCRIMWHWIMEWWLMIIIFHNITFFFYCKFCDQINAA